MFLNHNIVKMDCGDMNIKNNIVIYFGDSVQIFHICLINKISIAFSFVCEKFFNNREINKNN